MYVFLLIIINHYSIFDTTYILSSKFLSISKVKMPLKKGNDYLNIYEITLLIGDCIRAFVFFKTMKVLITLTSLLLFGLRTQATRSPWSYNQDFDKGDVFTTRRQLFPQRTFVFDDAPELGELQYRRMHSKTLISGRRSCCMQGATEVLRHVCCAGQILLCGQLPHLPSMRVIPLQMKSA